MTPNSASLVQAITSRLDTRSASTPAPVGSFRLLHLEDSEPDHALAMAYLSRAGLDVQTLRVESRDEFAAALAQTDGQVWDVVLSDYHLPGFSGLDALQMLSRSGLLLPFILVSGQIGEDTAVEAMRMVHGTPLIMRWRV